MKEIQLTKGYVAFVDDDDFERLMLFKWRVRVSGPKNKYAVTSVKVENRQKTVQMHRLLLSADDSTLQVDHINGNGLDNRRCNIRIATVAQNQFNQGPKPSNTSGYKGVFLHKKTGKYVAQIRNGSKRLCLGYFPTAVDAAAAYNNAAIIYHGEFARLNTLSYLENI